MTLLIISVVVLPQCFAMSEYNVFSENIKSSPGKSITVPVRLKNNKGIMGFKISVEYPDEQLKPKDISSGSLTTEGLFNTSIFDYNSVKGEFDVVWSHTKNIKADGTLFLLTFLVSDLADYGEYQIKLGYSTEDTFNEKWESVKLNCSSVKVKISDSASVTEPQKENSVMPNDNTEGVSDDYLISSAKAVPGSFDCVDVNGDGRLMVTDYTKLLKRVKRIEMLW